MAKKEEKEKIVLERVYNVPLRKEYMKAPKWKRSKKAVKALREFIAKHMKSDKVLIGKYANQFVWRDGIKNPPHHVKVKVTKDDKGVVKVELAELSPKAQREVKKFEEAEKESKEKKTKEEKEKKAKEEKEKKEKEAKEKKEGKIEEKVAGVKEEKAEKAKEIQKEEIKELKKEQPKQPVQKQPAIPKQVEQRPTAPKSV